MPYCKLYYHVIWGTKNREPLITPEIESVLYDFIRSKAIGLGGIVYALNGTEDHIHLLVHIPTTIPIAQFIGKIKGATSANLNKSGAGDGHFYWQTEYSVFTISEKQLTVYMKYVENQKRHHETGTTNSQFELWNSTSRFT
jgi:REP element-mobilizing transposase RayT